MKLGLMPILSYRANGSVDFEVNMAYGCLFDYIFGHCVKIKYLSLEKCGLYNCDPNNKSINKSLKELSLCWSNLSNDILPQLSARLPSSKFLDLIDCDYEEGPTVIRSLPNGDESYYGIAICMEHSFLKKIVYSTARIFR